jgi:putative addiction module component (TIGR02574 family)
MKVGSKSMIQRDEIVQQAMGLPPADRAYVADAIEQSLADGGFATPETAAEWVVEIERRVAAYDRGELSAVDGEAALKNMRRRLAEHRGQKGSA